MPIVDEVYIEIVANRRISGYSEPVLRPDQPAQMAIGTVPGRRHMRRSNHLRGLVLAIVVAIGILGTALPVAADGHLGPWPSGARPDVTLQ